MTQVVNKIKLSAEELQVMGQLLVEVSGGT
jgi:hypothetical protein